MREVRVLQPRAGDLFRLSAEKSHGLSADVKIKLAVLHKRDADFSAGAFVSLDLALAGYLYGISGWDAALGVAVIAAAPLSVLAVRHVCSFTSRVTV